MKKSIIAKVLVSVMAVALVLTVPVFAQAAERGEAVEMSVEEDGKTHSVCVFGTSLTLVSTDGSIEVAPIGGLTGVDVMIDGVVTKNVSAFSAPAGQKTRMTLDEGSILVNNVTAESSAAIKQQVSEAYAKGAETVDLSALSALSEAVYTIDKSGEVKDASGNKVSSKTIGMEVSSAQETCANFAERIEEIKLAEIAAERAAQEAKAAANAPASITSSASTEEVGTTTPDETKDPDGTVDPEDPDEDA